ncbi:MAG TPA: hypothetical protein ENI02_02995 [Candidatus Aminicenantes bacterium]|nr:hypothetical protein [Candidatus Aminicenantes bacterium]
MKKSGLNVASVVNQNTGIGLASAKKNVFLKKEKMSEEQLDLAGQKKFSKEEEGFLSKAALEENGKSKPLDVKALQEMGLDEEDIKIVGIFFDKVIAIEFIPHKFTDSECLQECISALEYLPRADEKTGKITLKSYKLSDTIYLHRTSSETDSQMMSKWSDKFRYEYGHALLQSFKEKVHPLLLDSLKKVYDWIVDFQKKNNLFEDLPEWLQAGMRGDFKDDSWVGSDLYEGKKTSKDIDDEFPDVPYGDSEDDDMKKMYPKQRTLEKSDLSKAEKHNAICEKNIESGENFFFDKETRDSVKKYSEEKELTEKEMEEIEKRCQGKFAPEEATEKQKGYLGFLATTVQNDQHRTVIQKKLDSFTKEQASAIISCLLNNRENLIEVLP